MKRNTLKQSTYGINIWYLMFGNLIKYLLHFIGKYTVLGVTSWEYGCGHAGVYAHVQKLLPWIMDQLQTNIWYNVYTITAIINIMHKNVHSEVNRANLKDNTSYMYYWYVSVVVYDEYNGLETIDM